MTASIVALLALAQAASAPARPAPDVWIAYNVGVSGGGTVPSADDTLLVTHGGGAMEIFAVRLQRSSRESLAAQVLRPANYDRHALFENEVVRDPPSDDPYSEASRQMGLLQEALRHHQPPATIRVGRDGRAIKLFSDSVREHRRCAHRLLRAARERLVATAENESQRESEQERLDNGDDRRLAAVRVDSPVLLLQLLQLDLRPVATGYWTALHREIEADRGRNRSLSQFDWRWQQIQLHGSEFELRVDLLRDRTSPTARLCRTLRPRGATSPLSDLCSIDAVVDRRDGWPIAVNVVRRIRGANRADVHAAKSFSRLAPLQGFVAPPNPCGPPER
ncbi:MAG TPA: hypothetical protein VF577_08580 [Allosphingosinicella sp.]